MSGSIELASVENYRFNRDDLAPANRLPGISAFMRIKNGADFLEHTIRSHMPHFDEIVAVYNQCTDTTPDILARLAAEFGPERMRVFHYLPKVFPPGSEGHAHEPADGPHSFVNMSNFALTRTRYRIVMKLDDDHLAIDQRLGAIAGSIRHGGYRLDQAICLSGLNVARNESDGGCGVPLVEPFSGNGDTAFFTVSSRTRFIRRARFEAFDYAGNRRVFGDFAYWHMKYLKNALGFGNRDIADGNPRFARKRDALLADRRLLSVAELRSRTPAWVSLTKFLPLPEKAKLKSDRWLRLLNNPPDQAGLAAAGRLRAVSDGAGPALTAPAVTTEASSPTQ